MPKIVDHDARRREIAQATLNTVRIHGLDKTTLRAIAREGKVTSGLLIYYFNNRDEILEYAFNWLADQEIAALNKALANASDLKNQVQVIADFLVPVGPKHKRQPLNLWAEMSKQRNILKSYDRLKQHVSSYLVASLQARTPLSDKQIMERQQENIEIFLISLEGLLLAMNLHPRKYGSSHVARLKTRFAEQLLEI